MIKSMTGFASLSRDVDPVGSVSVTLRSVNHRHLDLQVRAPQSIAASEPRLRALVQRHLARGRIELSVSMQMRRPGAIEVELNEEFAEAVGAALGRARERGLVEGALTPGDLLRFPQALVVRDRPADADPAVVEQIARAVEEIVEEALRELDTMRAREGEYLRADLDGRRQIAGDLIDRATALADLGRADAEARLIARVQELRLDPMLEAGTVAQEVVRSVARSDVSEEVARFRGHLAHWRALTDAPEPCGRKLDFLLQEMNREANTLGAKAEGVAMPEVIVNLKAELEKMREQVQNVE